MRLINGLLIAVLAIMMLVSCDDKADVVVDGDYLVVASDAVMADDEWSAVAETLAARHNADIVTFTSLPREALDAIREAYPRYVAVVDMPENIGRDYVIDLHHVCREMDDDIYGDFLWGIITGYDAAAAMRMVENSAEPLVVKDAVAQIEEVYA